MYTTYWSLLSENGVTLLCNLMPLTLQNRGRDSSVATGWTVRGANPSEDENFPHPSRSALGPTQPSLQGVPDYSRGVKRPGRGVIHLLASCAVV